MHTLAQTPDDLSQKQAALCILLSIAHKTLHNHRSSDITSGTNLNLTAKETRCSFRYYSRLSYSTAAFFWYANQYVQSIPEAGCTRDLQNVCPAGENWCQRGGRRIKRSKKFEKNVRLRAGGWHKQVHPGFCTSPKQRRESSKLALDESLLGRLRSELEKAQRRN